MPRLHAGIASSSIPVPQGSRYSHPPPKPPPPHALQQPSSIILSLPASCPMGGIPERPSRSRNPWIVKPLGKTSPQWGKTLFVVRGPGCYKSLGHNDIYTIIGL